MKRHALRDLARGQFLLLAGTAALSGVLTAFVLWYQSSSSALSQAQLYGYIWIACAPFIGVCIGTVIGELAVAALGGWRGKS